MTTLQFKSIAPVINLNRRTMKPTIDLFVEKLGFEIDTLLGTPPSFAMLKKDGLVIMFYCRPIIPWPHKGWATYIWVGDVDALYQDLIERGAPVCVDPHDRDYGVRELQVEMPDGRVIVFGQELQR